MHSLDRIALAIQFECFRSRKLAKILHPTVEFAQPTEKSVCIASENFI